MVYTRQDTWDVIRELNGALIWSIYTNIGTATTKPIRTVIFKNHTDVDMYFSTVYQGKFDPPIDMIKCGPYSYSTYDITTHRSYDDDPLLIKVGTQFYARCDPLVWPAAGTWVSVECLIAELGV